MSAGMNIIFLSAIFCIITAVRTALVFSVTVFYPKVASAIPLDFFKGRINPWLCRPSEGRKNDGPEAIRCRGLLNDLYPNYTGIGQI